MRELLKIYLFQWRYNDHPLTRVIRWHKMPVSRWHVIGWESEPGLWHQLAAKEMDP